MEWNIHYYLPKNAVLYHSSAFYFFLLILFFLVLEELQFHLLFSQMYNRALQDSIILIKQKQMVSKHYCKKTEPNPKLQWH